MDYKPTIGLEIHVELKTKSKMFCSCKNDPDEKEPNVNICPVCLGHPGVLPVPNEEAIRKVIKVGLALNCQIASFTRFDRKNYFYPDLPKNYQITQLDFPLCKNGFLKIGEKEIRIKRIHLEEDTGRSIHLEDKGFSLIDFNRAGIPLMELVTEPDIHSAREAKDFAKELQLILRYLDVAEANMEKGQMRVEANISVSKGKHLGTKVEVKNLNSFKAVERAIDYEVERQIYLLENGEKVSQQTVGWNPNTEKTFIQRKKEGSHDYRYFPEPDIPPFDISKDLIEKIELSVPELPQEKRRRFKKEFNLFDKEVEFFVQNFEIGDYFEKVISELDEWLKEKNKLSERKEAVKIATNYIISDLQGLMNQEKISISELKITPENFAEFVTLLINKDISSKIAKSILLEMFKTGADPSHIIEDRGLSKISGDQEILKIVEETLRESKKAVEDYKKGKEEALQFILGKTMAKTKGRIDPQKALEKIKEIIERI